MCTIHRFSTNQALMILGYWITDPKDFFYVFSLNKIVFEKPFQCAAEYVSSGITYCCMFEQRISCHWNPIRTLLSQEFICLLSSPILNLAHHHF